MQMNVKTLGELKRVEELEILIKSCNPKALSRAFILGEKKVGMANAKRVARLIAQFELDCKCIKK